MKEMFPKAQVKVYIELDLRNLIAKKSKYLHYYIPYTKWLLL